MYIIHVWNKMCKFVSKYIKVHVSVCHYSLILHVVPGIFCKFPVILFSVRIHI